MDTFILDEKTLMPRVGKLGGRLNPNTRAWSSLKRAVCEGTEVDWAGVGKRFVHAELACATGRRPATRAEHRTLKGIYAFFQNGYILRSGDRIGLFVRSAENARLLRGGSVIVSSSPTAIGQHDAVLAKLAGKLRQGLEPKSIRPFAIGYSELTRTGKSFAPAYFWLLHEVVVDDLPKRCAPVLRGDSFVGMKRIERLSCGDVTVSRRRVQLGGAFDQLLLDCLQSGTAARSGGAAIRRLTRSEVASIPAIDFRRKQERVDRRLGKLGLLSAAGVFAGTVDWVRRVEFVENNVDIVEYADVLADLVAKLF